jgi:hypothetical protein
MADGNQLLKHLPGQLHGEVHTEDVTISGTYPTLLPPTPLRGRKDFILYNGSGEVIYIGGDDVDSFNGLPLADEGVLAVQAGRAGLYAVSTSATVSGIRVLEVA